VSDPGLHADYGYGFSRNSLLASPPSRPNSVFYGTANRQNHTNSSAHLFDFNSSGQNGFGLTAPQVTYARWRPDWDAIYPAIAAGFDSANRNGNIVNGDFESVDPGKQIAPGWSHHGSGGGGLIGGDTNNHFLILRNSVASEDSRTHNWLYLPKDAGRIAFDVQRMTGSDSQLWVLLGNTVIGTYILSSSDAGFMPAIPVSIPTDLRGQTCTLTFELFVPSGSSSTTEVHIDNVRFLPNPLLTVSAGGSYSVGEGLFLQLNGSATDPYYPASSLTYAWDLDGDGIFGETGSAAANGNETGPTPTFNAGNLDGPSTRTVAMRVTDPLGAVGTSTATITINNLPPTATFTGTTAPVSTGGTAAVFFGSQFDFSITDRLAGFRYAYDFNNDGAFDLGTGTYAGSVTSPTAIIPPVYLTQGPHAIHGRIIDKDDSFTNYTTTVTVGPPTTPGGFKGLGFLPGGNFSRAGRVSADGSVVVGQSNSISGYQAFRWTAVSGMVGLGYLPGESYSGAADVSADGSVVAGGGGSAFGEQGWRWTVAGGLIGLSDPPGSLFPIRGYGVSADGSVIVGPGSGAQAYRWTAAGGAVGLNSQPGGVFIVANGVSADGSVIVGQGNPSATEAYRWTAAGGAVSLGDLPGGDFSSAATKVSADGSVVVGLGHSASGEEAFRWTVAGGMVGLGDLPGGTFDSTANWVSPDGSVVVGIGTSASGSEAFWWTAAGGMRNLRDMLITDYGLASQLAGWRLTEAYGCSADVRVVVGYGINPAGQTEAWSARLDPSPPRVQAVSVNNGSAQRSRVTSLTVTFSAQVSFAGSVAGAFRLSRIGGGSVGGFTATPSIVGGVTVVTLSGFFGAETRFGSLADGGFSLTVLANQVSVGGQQLDGNGDGIPGGDYVLNGTAANGLFALFGDANGDSVVNGFDFGQFRNAFGSSSTDSAYIDWLDYNGDGTINGFDFGQFRNRFGTNLFP
jgi:probable HAF family extracellular repeat protein